MIVPLSCDVSGGIPQRKLGTLGNLVYGDCVVAAYYHIEMFKNVAKGSTFRKFLWKIGFTPPTNQQAIAEYSTYLATLGEKPSPFQGVSPDSFLAWQKSQGNVVAWASVDCSNETALHGAMATFRGVLLCGDLTINAMNSIHTWTTGTTAHDQPDPNFGHAVALDHYRPDYDECITWGRRQRMTPEFRALCMTYGYVFVLESERSSPDFDMMMAEIKLLPNASY